MMEEIYQFAWQHRLWGEAAEVAPGGLCMGASRGSGAATLVDGRCVTVLDPGRLNRDAGPDFFNAKVMIDGTEWVGNVEIHVRASDWRRHGHSADRAYDNVVLHVVGADDERVRRADGSEVPQLVIAPPRMLMERYAELREGMATVRCGQWLRQLPALAVSDCLESLAVERVQRKAAHIAAIADACSGDWRQACFATLARALGFGLNADALELLGRSVPLQALGRHSDSLMQTEALLFGQAGMLDDEAAAPDERMRRLSREYGFLRRKYGLRPMPAAAWRFARTRPQNMPHRRIALLARACFGGFTLAGDLLDAAPDADAVQELFERTLCADASGSAIGILAQLSAASLNLLIINCAVPFCFAYAARRSDADRAEAALDLLSRLPAEDNTIVRTWASLGLKPENALRSQALIELRREYCEARKCMYCRIGHKTLRNAFS